MSPVKQAKKNNNRKLNFEENNPEIYQINSFMKNEEPHFGKQPQFMNLGVEDGPLLASNSKHKKKSPVQKHLNRLEKIRNN